jgi:hypothetical protein
MTAAADRHLLFGLLALQNGLIDQQRTELAVGAQAIRSMNVRSTWNEGTPAALSVAVSDPLSLARFAWSTSGANDTSAFAVSAVGFGFRSLSHISDGSEISIRVGLQDQRATEARHRFSVP